MKLKRFIATLLTVVVLMGLLPIVSLPASAVNVGSSMFSDISLGDHGKAERTISIVWPRMYDSGGAGSLGAADGCASYLDKDGHMAADNTERPVVIAESDLYKDTPSGKSQVYIDSATSLVNRSGVAPILRSELWDSGFSSNTPVDFNGMKKEASEYVAFGLYTSWLAWDTYVWRTTVTEGKIPEISDFTLRPSIEIKSYERCAIGDGGVAWEVPSSRYLDFWDVYSNSVKGTVTIDSDMWHLEEFSTLVNMAFGSGVYELLSDPKNGLGMLSADDYERMRSVLVFLHLFVDGTGNSEDDLFKMGIRLMTQPQQRALKQNLVNDIIKDMTTSGADALEAAWYLHYQIWLAGETTGSVTWTDAALAGNDSTKSWWSKYQEQAASSTDGQFVGGNFRTGSACNPFDAATWVYRNWQSNYSTMPTNLPERRVADKNSPTANQKQAYILSAKARLQQLQTDLGGLEYQATPDMVARTEYFVYRFYVAYGVAYGILPREDLQLLLYNPKGDKVLYAPAPSFLNNTSTVYNIDYAGVWALLAVYNEYRSIVFDLTNNTAQYIASKGSTNDLNSIMDQKDAILLLYNLLDNFNDANMWDVWNDKKMDFMTENEADKKSLSDVYDFLVAQHAFDGTLSSNMEGDVNNVWCYFFNKDGMADPLLTGIKQSAMYLPMHTNVYDPATWNNVDTAWLLNYYAKFGYFRKALYIDTSADAAVNFGNTGGRGQLAVATLEDLLQDKDIVLYLDDNLYNVNVLSDLIGQAWDRIGQGEGSDSRGTIDKLGGLITELWEVSMPELAKTGERTTYSGRVNAEDASDPSNKWGGLFFSNVMEKDDEVDQEGGQSTQQPATTTPAPSTAPPAADSQDVIEDPDATGSVYKPVQSSDTIFYYLWPDRVWDEVSDQQVKDGDTTARTTEYTPLFGFAVLSAVYKDDSLKDQLNNVLSANTPVFVSSGSAPYSCSSLQNSIYNYMLVRNLEAQIPVDYAANLDMTSPLYMDVFGNILTESGYVVIPAAANATLWGSQYVPRNAAFFSCYGDSYHLPYYGTQASSGVEKMLTSGDARLCTADEETGRMLLNALRTTDSTVNAAMLSTANQEALQDVADTWAAYIKGGVRAKSAPYSKSMWQMIVTEVLRGAPIESIDKQFEGIQTDVSFTRNGLIIADKLETLCNSIAPAGQNASLAIPNPAFIDGIEIIVFFVYKLLILAVLIIWMVNVYLDATGGVIGWKTGAKCIGVVVLVLALIVGVPKVFELSYYESNKHLLQDETEYLLMLNTEKKANGQEIGVSKVRPPETSTDLYLHLADINMPWWDLLSQIGLSAGYKSLDEMYKDYSNMHPLAYSEYATTMNDGIYISIDQLFSSAGVQFSPLSKRIYMTGSDNTPASYYTPYYWFLYSITEGVADWSKSNNAVAYTTKVQKGGELKTLGYCKLFFESPDFLEENGDYFHLNQVYGIWTERNDNMVIQESTLAQLRESQWCSYQNGQMSDKGYTDRINKLQTYAQEWIANNHGMIGRISDETFLKCFALSCAMEHNRLFNTQRADYLEIQQLSNEDLLRLSIADHNKVMSNSSMSYARFVYTTGGTIACYLAAILELVSLVSSWVKPACTLLVFCIACISIFVLKLILRRGNNSIMGYILTITLMCSVNVLGAAVTKLSMFLPNTGLTPSLCILLQVLVQIGYIFLQLKIVSFAMRDWRNIGYQQYEHQFNKLHLPGYRSENISRNVLTPHGFTGYDELDRLNNRKLGRRIRK